MSEAPQIVVEPDSVAQTDAHEGPVYVAEEDALYFTTVRRDRVSIKRLALGGGSISVVRDDANMANGMALAPDGRLIVCEQGTLTRPARITLVDRSTGETQPLVDRVDGLPFNSPNDVVVKTDGSIWFTDPSYGWLQGFRPRPQVPDRVYRFDPETGRLDVVLESLDKPNGLAFSPDEQTLYVGDNGSPHHLLAFDVEHDLHPTCGRVLAVSTPEHPDGIKVDNDGWIYASFADGIQIIAPTGELVGEVLLPGAVNFTFGGADEATLYITADTGIWAAAVPHSGV